MGFKKIWLLCCPSLKMILVTFDTLTDFLYYISETFYNVHLMNACLAFIMLYPATGWALGVFYIKKYSDNRKCLKFFVAILGLIFWPIIFTLSPIIFAIFRIVKPDSDKTKLFGKITYFEAFFESLPQIIIQATNSTLMKNWSNTAIFSITFSCLSLLLNLYSLTGFLKESEYTETLKFDNKSSMLIYIFIALFNLTAYLLTIAYMIFIPFNAPMLRFITIMFLSLMFMISFLETSLYGEEYYDHRAFKPLITFAFGPFVGKKLKYSIIYYNFFSLLIGLIPIIIIQVANNEITQNWRGLNLVAVIFNCTVAFTQCFFHPCKCFYNNASETRV